MIFNPKNHFPWCKLCIIFQIIFYNLFYLWTKGSKIDSQQISPSQLNCSWIKLKHEIWDVFFFMSFKSVLILCPYLPRSFFLSISLCISLSLSLSLFISLTHTLSLSQLRKADLENPESGSIGQMPLCRNLYTLNHFSLSQTLSHILPLSLN